MASLKARLVALRERWPWLDHLLRMLGHYGSVNGNGQAGAVTYFGFLSVFPILALAVFVVGLLAQVYPDIRGQMIAEIDRLLPGVVGTGANEIDLDTMGSYSGLAGLVGLAGVLYSGLGWISALRLALEAMFVVPARERPGFLPGKLRDLATLGLIGLVLIVSVVLSSAVTSFSGHILDWVGIDATALLPQILLGVLGHALAVVASTVMLLAMFGMLLAESHVPRSALVQGAVLGAVGFEVLKSAANLLLAQTKSQPAFQAFGVALILVVWIYYFSRLVMYSAAWAYTAPAAREQRAADALRVPGAAQAADPGLPDPAADSAGGTSQPRPWRLALGAAAVGGAAAWIVRGGRQ
jgi:membrane protein